MHFLKISTKSSMAQDNYGTTKLSSNPGLKEQNGLHEKEKDDLLHQDQHNISKKTAGRLRVGAVVISWLSVVFSFSTGVAGLVLGSIDKSEALFGYGLDATLDGLSSVAVLWRFYGDVNDIYSQTKERRACIVIGSLFILSGVLLTGKSIHGIVAEVHETKALVMYLNFALITGVVSLCLAVVKVYLGCQLGSKALATDSIITFVGAAMSFAGVAGLEMYVQNTSLWFMDSVFGITCGLFLCGFGIKLLIEIVWLRKMNDEHIEIK
ncbi:transmembrane protein 163-like isoform X3 [Pomacea canaliculata]|uniref:transmembrane protein 163-like isoform X3 n=1 Tax=Pomacea canaliculata TaxID=400727 RepID=UPI000D737195|nr:transmembrane protein 163-like isoform X3 [Pomacea canaliculata]